MEDEKGVVAGSGAVLRGMTISLAVASSAFSGLAIYLFEIYVEIHSRFRDLTEKVPIEVLVPLDRPVGRIRVYVFVVILAAIFGAVAAMGRPRGAGWVALAIAAFSSIVVSGMP
jgi:hypothetical protein